MTDVAAAPIAPVTATPPAAPEIPGTPAEAAARLATLRADRGWGERLLASDKQTVDEFHALAKKANEASDIDRVLAGEPGLPDVNVDGKLSLVKISGEIPALLESGLSQGVIRELLEGRVPSTEELTAVKRFQAMRHSDPNWVKAYLSGQFEQVRESRLMSAVLLAAPE
jgi:hypothetical protein